MYYGDPAAVRFAAQSVTQAIKNDNFEEVVMKADMVVTPLLESELAGIFEAMPTKNSTQDSAISTLWVFAMAEYLTRVYSSTSRNIQTGYKDSNQNAYETIMRKIKNAEMLVPGASRRKKIFPTQSIFKQQAFLPDPVEFPEGYNEQYQHGLRR